MLIGGAGDDTLKLYSTHYLSSDQQNIFNGGVGNDTLKGSFSSDTYIFNLGDGQDTISDNAGSYTSEDTIEFGPGITRAHLRISHKDNNHILIELLDDNGTPTGDHITIYSAYTNATYQIEHITFADGTYMTLAEIIEASRLLLGTDGNDTLYGSENGDILDGLAGNDILIGNDNADNVLIGGAGDDTLELYSTDGSSRNQQNIFNGGVGNDTLKGSSSSTSTIPFNFSRSGLTIAFLNLCNMVQAV